MMKPLRLSCFLAAWLMFASCAKYNGRSEVPEPRSSRQEGGALHKIYVDEVKSQSSISKVEKLEVKILGNLPSPAYEFNRFEVNVQGSVIEITPLADYSSGKMVAQVLVPFEEVCNVENLTPGTYEVKVFGRGDAVVTGQRIKVQK
ncbi:MAG: hypothetical protein ACE5IY_02920 [bacterium]